MREMARLGECVCGPWLPSSLLAPTLPPIPISLTHFLKGKDNRKRVSDEGYIRTVVESEEEGVRPDGGLQYPSLGLCPLPHPLSLLSLL